MKNLIEKIALAVALVAVLPQAAVAQDKVEVSAGFDLVSGYIWRGQDCGDVSIQPSLGISYKGLSLSAWGSTGFESEDTKEFDLTLGYSISGFSISVTDYWFDNGPGYFHFHSHNTAHVVEAQIGYDFGFLAFNWYTNLAGNDGVQDDGDRAYSSYMSIAVPFTLCGLDWSAEVAATPWETSYYNGGANGFEVCDVNVGATKTFDLGKKFTLPVFVKAIWNPATEGTYFVAGVSIAFNE